MSRPQFDLGITVSAASYFVHLAGGALRKYRLVKYLYFLDREALKRWGFPVTNDSYDAMKNGPVPSHISMLADGKVCEDLWSEYFSHDESMVRLEKTDPDFDYLSEAETGLVKEISETYRDVGDQEFKDLCHNLPEWTDPGELERSEISFDELMKNIIQNSDQRETMINELEYDGYCERLFQAYSSSR